MTEGSRFVYFFWALKTACSR